MENNTVHPFQRVGLGIAPFRYVGYSKETYQAIPGVSPIQAGSSCDYCGTAIMNVFWILSSDAKRFKVGCDCVYKTSWGSGLAKEVKAEVRKQLAVGRDAKRAVARVAREAIWAQQSADRRVAFIASHPGLVEALKADHDISRDLADRFAKWGDLSENQVALAHKLLADSLKPKEVNIPAPEGKQTVTGKIVSVKTHEGPFGTVQRMTVKVTTDAGVWLCWGTVPDNIKDFSRFDARAPKHYLVGDTVRFNATLTRGNDAHFAFFKRPTKAAIVARWDGTAVEVAAQPVTHPRKKVRESAQSATQEDEATT